MTNRSHTTSEIPIDSFSSTQNLKVSHSPPVPRSVNHRRLMTGEEQLAALGYPCIRALAVAARVVPWHRL